MINNFTREPLTLDVPDNLQSLQGQCLISNYAPREQLGARLQLQPYESFALLIGSL